MALITAGAVVIGIVAIAANPLLNQPPSAAHLVDPAKPAPAALASGMALGEADAKVTIDAYADTPRDEDRPRPHHVRLLPCRCGAGESSEADTAAALQAGIHQTPTLIVDGTTLGSWGLQAVSAAIDSALTGAGQGPSVASSASPPSGPPTGPPPTPQVAPARS